MADMTTQDMKNILFLRAVLDGFQAKMLEYYNAGATTEERRQRALQITDKLRVIKFQDGAKKFTIGAKKVVKGGAKAKSAASGTAPTVDYTCPEGEFCCKGTCVRNGTPCLE